MLPGVAVVRDQDPLAVGTARLDAADWDPARQAFEAALALAPSADAHEGLGLALWFLGRVPEALQERERAFDGYVAAGRCDDAARMAVWVSHQHLLAGRASAARGWLARAERVLDGLQGPCAGLGWIAVERARHAPGLAQQIALARRAMRIGRATGAADLEVFALSLLGRAVVTSGRRDEGLALLEEAMAAASSGRVRNVHTLAEAYCNLIEGCAAAGEWERGAEWCELVEDFARTHSTAPLFGACRTIHADVLVATGHWPEAETALQTALDTHARYVPQMGEPAVASLVELRVRQGRLVEAARLLEAGPEQPGALRSAALLRLAEGRPDEAVALLERALRQAADHPVRAALLLAPLADARLECADLDGAARAAGELEALAAACAIRLVCALADLTAARVACTGGRAEDAAAAARRALTAFRDLAMPFETAQARLVLARATGRSAPEVAADEARTALAAFRSLGAPRAADVAGALLRDLGGGVAPRQRVAGELTAREREVLALIALGSSNADIAAALCISGKTAGHHVSRILAKLGVRNRTQAAAHARRLGS